MKNFTFGFILTAGLAIPLLSHAGETASAIRSSFERDLNRQPVAACTDRKVVDPVQYQVDSTLHGSSKIAFAFLQNGISGVIALDRSADL